MGRIERTVRADLDYRDIYHYIAQDNVTAAVGFLRKLDEKLLRASDMPLAGATRPDLGKKVRSWSVGKYLLLYRPIKGGIELLRVIHGARKVRRVFRRGEP